MPVLSDQQRQTLQDIGVLRDRGYSTGPDFVNSDNNDLYNAACWSWALTGGYMSVDNAMSAAKIYQNCFTWNMVDGSTPEEEAAMAERDRLRATGVAEADLPPIPVVEEIPTGINSGEGTWLNNMAQGNDNVPELIGVMHDNFANALAGNGDAQKLVKIALLKIVAIAHGFTLTDNTANAATLTGMGAGTDVSDPNIGNYAMHMRGTSWYGWDHWGISVLLPNGTRSCIQKVNGNDPDSDRPIDGHVFRNCTDMWDGGMPLTTISLTGILATQVAIITAP